MEPISYNYSPEVEQLLSSMEELGEKMRFEFLTPELAIKVLISQQAFRNSFKEAGGNIHSLETEIEEYLSSIESVPENIPFQMHYSEQFTQVLDSSFETIVCASQREIKIPHIIKAIFSLPESFAAWALRKGIKGNEGGFMSAIVSHYSMSAPISDLLWDELDDEGEELPDNDGEQWKRLVVCLNDNLEDRNPLIGREKELARTIQVLCRKEKNNPLHIGEPGVGKTALVYGLARLINEGEVPERLKGAKIYGLDLGTLLAGTQFRGDFEKRLKMIMEGLSREENVIVYIDEIHSLVGAGATGESAMDASNMLKPYLEAGKIRFIGSTTYDEYKRHFAKSKGLVRRFSQIDVLEPSVSDTIEILNRLKENYESFHGVVYDSDAIEFAVKGAANHINDRFLPDKAIDLIDEAGAYRQAKPLPTGSNIVDKTLIADILSKICKVDALAISQDADDRLEYLRERISNKIYGQDEAVRNVTEAVQMAKAGLTEPDKPLASLLFVGPTGVGKTEVAKVLAHELGIELIRFDMSEYTEKHTVAKLIGSPAGYVGYEDGGLLTDAIRKTPDCVLLLDEIEKAHSDIYNILLQVMDYAKLTDNKGNKADFRNVVLIMTSNAGAQYASQANVGFASNVSAGSAMMAQVKKTFKPEFLNRLSATVVFNDMDRKMASLILDKKLSQLQERLKGKNVTLRLSDEAHDYLLSTGFSKEYGARELDRRINSTLKPLLMRAILFGSLKNGGEAFVSLTDGSLTLLPPL